MRNLPRGRNFLSRESIAESLDSMNIFPGVSFVTRNQPDSVHENVRKVDCELIVESPSQLHDGGSVRVLIFVSQLIVNQVRVIEYGVMREKLSLPPSPSLSTCSRSFVGNFSIGFLFVSRTFPSLYGIKQKGSACEVNPCGP